MSPTALFGAGAVPLIAGIIQVFKATGMPVRLAPLIALGLGVGAGCSPSGRRRPRHDSLGRHDRSRHHLGPGRLGPVPGRQDGRLGPPSRRRPVCRRGARKGEPASQPGESPPPKVRRVAPAVAPVAPVAAAKVTPVDEPKTP